MMNFSSDSKKPAASSIEAVSPHFDPITGLHTFNYHIPELQSILYNQKALGLVFIDATELGKIEYDYGKEIYNKILREVVSAIESLKGHLVRTDDILTVRHAQDELFLLFLSG